MKNLSAEGFELATERVLRIADRRALRSSAHEYHTVQAFESQSESESKPPTIIRPSRRKSHCRIASAAEQLTGLRSRIGIKRNDGGIGSNDKDVEKRAMEFDEVTGTMTTTTTTNERVCLLRKQADKAGSARWRSQQKNALACS